MMSVQSSVSGDESFSQELLHPNPTMEQNKKNVDDNNRTRQFHGNISGQQTNHPLIGKLLKRTSITRHSSSLSSLGREKSSVPPEIIVATGPGMEISAVTANSSEANALPETAAIVMKSSEAAMGIRLIYEDTPNKTGELVLDTIFNMIESNGGWNVCVGKGKKMQFFELVAKRLFDKNNGMLNMVKPVSGNVLQNKFCHAVKILDKIASATHSNHGPDYGEEYPSHLAPIIKKYLQIIEGCDGAKNGTVVPASVINHQVQKTLDLVSPPIGPNENNPSRHPTRAGNEATGITGLVKRGAQYNKVVDTAQDQSKTKMKKNHGTSPETVVRDISKHQETVSLTLQSLSENISKRSKLSPDEMTLKMDKFEFQKEVISRKMEIESKRASIEDRKAAQDSLYAKLRVVDERIQKNKLDIKEYKETGEHDLYDFAKKNLMQNMKLKGQLEMQLFDS